MQQNEKFALQRKKRGEHNMNWQNLFQLIKKMWDVTQTELTLYLDNTSDSTISRLITGKQLSTRLERSMIYTNVFDHSNPKSLVHAKDQSATDASLLSQLIESLKELNLFDKVKHLHTDNYEKFVKDILKLVKANESKNFSHSQKNISVTSQKKGNQQGDETPLKELSYEFYLSCQNYGLEDFIKQDPFTSLRPYQIEDAISLIGHINTCHSRNDSLDKDSDINKNIIKFTEDLSEYIKMLRRCSDNTKTFPDEFTPIKGNEMSQEIKALRNTLQSSYASITATIEDRLNKL